MAQCTFSNLINRMDDAADRSGCASAFWQQVALVLRVWESVKEGWMPVVQFDPRYNHGLSDLSAAYKRFGGLLVSEANSRAFAA